MLYQQVIEWKKKNVILIEISEVRLLPDAHCTLHKFCNSMLAIYFYHVADQMHTSVALRTHASFSDRINLTEPVFL